jgi:hypothetical protein
MAGLDPVVILLAGGGVLGVVFGFAAERSQFCLLSGLRDPAGRQHTGKLPAFLLAAHIAVAGAQTIQA